MNSPDEAALWAVSGAMAITGLRGSTPLVPTSRRATAVAWAPRQVADRTEAAPRYSPSPGTTSAPNWRMRGAWWMNSPDEIALWATSGAMAISGQRDATPFLPTGRPATAVTRALRQVAEYTEARTGIRPALPGLHIDAELLHTWRLVDELT
ncbi:hypothetical protein VSH64_10780 [Amycolatopsis rhabdoformis]|uniref:Uncharacterized protein n=1 Tax=Amycolatopsis rhabdoformis TaxID=1448059 RepID=A0ABZ1IGM9_9PSEU|nr:hypothetical protein [Amycolatopsis rhabdoformis]WSE32590.1 hypothetical protein VSH64_10780 [Amycolatopsis rhabdoformis]